MAYDPTDPTQNMFAYGGNKIDAQTGEKTFVPSVVNSASLTPFPPINYSVPSPTAVPSITGLDTELPDLKPTQPEQQATDLTARIQALSNSLTGEAAYRAEQEKAQGIPDLIKAQSDLATRLKTVQNEAAQIPLQLQQEAIGRGITAAGLAPIQTERLRTNAIQALSISSLLEASKGNLATAQTLADRAVAAKYDPMKAEVSAAKSNLDLILRSPEYSLAEKNRAQRQLALQTRKEKAIAKQEANAKEINTTLQTAIKYGLTDTRLMRQISEAQTPLEAQQLAANYLRDPKAKYELESARLDNILTQVQIEKQQADTAKTRRETAQIGQPTATERKEAAAAKEAAKGLIPAAREKLDLISSLINHAGLDSSVGPNSLSRMSVTDSFGAAQDFSAGIEQLLSQETIDTLLNLKKAGGTLGALSDSEREMLRTAASKIGYWAVKDENGKATGKYNASEEDFKKELEKIKRLATTAIENATSDVIQKDEQKVLDELWDNASSTLDSSFSPELYFAQ